MAQMYKKYICNVAKEKTFFETASFILGTITKTSPAIYTIGMVYFVQFSRAFQRKSNQC